MKSMLPPALFTTDSFYPQIQDESDCLCCMPDAHPEAPLSLLSPLTRQTRDTIYNLRVYGLCFLRFCCHRETFSSVSSAIKTTCLHTQLLTLPLFNTCTHKHVRMHATQTTISSWKLVNALVFFTLLLNKALFFSSIRGIFHNYLGFLRKGKKKQINNLYMLQLFQSLRCFSGQ